MDVAILLGDADGDKYPRYLEYVAGTDPSNAASFFRIADLVGDPEGVVVETVTGRLYTVDYVESPTGSVWQVLTNDAVGIGGPLIFQDPGPADQRFFRARVRLAP